MAGRRRSALVQPSAVILRGMKRHLHILSACAVVLSFTVALQAPASAQNASSRSAETDERFVVAQRVISARDAVAAAQRRYPGSRYVDTFAVYANGQVREHVVVLVTADGRRAFVRVDAANGAVIGECASRRACGG